jgi:acetyltransferase-like isoleucine patch superfamily enzyme
MGGLALVRGATRARNRLFTALVRGSFASFKAGSVFEPPTRIAGERRITIGAGVFVGAGSWLEALAGDGVALEVGDGCQIAGGCTLSAARSVRVGRDVLFARGVYVSDHIHAYRDPTRPVLRQGIDKIQPVEIGDGAWLGEHVVVCPGVRIGRGSVIGANAVVLDDVPDFCVAAGVPARVVRQFADDEVPV